MEEKGLERKCGGGSVEDKGDREEVWRRKCGGKWGQTGIVEDCRVGKCGGQRGQKGSVEEEGWRTKWTERRKCGGGSMGILSKKERDPLLAVLRLSQWTMSISFAPWNKSKIIYNAQ